MKSVISMVSLLAYAFSLDAQITATLNPSSEGWTEIKIRNNSAVKLTAFAASVNPVAQSGTNDVPLRLSVEPVYFDTAIDLTEKPLLPSEERTVRPTIHSRPGLPINDLLEKRTVTAGIFADGSTTGDTVLLTRLMLRRSNMLLAVETALETLFDAGRRNIPRERLIEQFKRMADSLRHWYLLPEQQIGLRIYQPIIGKLINLPQVQVGSAFPPASFVAEETAMLSLQRTTLSESQPSLADAARIGL